MNPEPEQAKENKVRTIVKIFMEDGVGIEGKSPMSREEIINAMEGGTPNSTTRNGYAEVQFFVEPHQAKSNTVRIYRQKLQGYLVTEVPEVRPSGLVGPSAEDIAKLATKH